MSEHPGGDCAAGDARDDLSFRPISRLAVGGLGTGDGAVQLGHGSVPVVLPGRWPPLPAHRAGVWHGRPMPGGRGASRWLVLGGQPGLSAGSWPACAAAASRSPSPSGVPGDQAGRAADISPPLITTGAEIMDELFSGN